MADRETVPPEPAHKVLLENTLIFHTRNGQSREADWQDFIYPNDPHAIVEIRETNLESENRVRQQVFVKFSQPNIAEKYQIGHIYFVAKSPFKCEQAMITTSLLINLSALTHIKPPLTVTAFRSILADLLQPTNIRTYSIVEMQHSLRILFPTRPEAKKVRDILINSHLFSPPSSFSPSTSIFSATDHFDQTVSITEQSKLKFIRWPNDFDNNHTFLFLSFKSKFIERVKYAQPNETEENIITQFKAWLITELEKLTEQVHRQLEEEHPDRRWKLPSLRIELNCENRVYLPGGHCFFRDVPLEEQEEYTRRVFNLLVKNHPSPAHREPHPAGSLVTNQFGGRTEVAVFINGGKDSDRKVKRNKIDARRRDIQKRKIRPLQNKSDTQTSSILKHTPKTQDSSIPPFKLRPTTPFSNHPHNPLLPPSISQTRTLQCALRFRREWSALNSLEPCSGEPIHVPTNFSSVQLSDLGFESHFIRKYHFIRKSHPDSSAPALCYLTNSVGTATGFVEPVQTLRSQHVTISKTTTSIHTIVPILPPQHSSHSTSRPTRT
ncbi:hypothetical protein BLNAU_16513 [Blattamonas nauphoetae]|uniref:Uncharacterized protein n=1 Tax=Blattamonas nauphoetae TaxID=2049346 RepID=A0ABQ9XB77_9EUKA|nr:hypothetical protein BLNAU_16513 [Blattamonas nauphoetae]